jgi:5-methylcytosine-specific restriction endonuclease McrA
MSRFRGTYTEDWGAIAKAIKERNNWQCERCYAVNDIESGHVLTVHHLDNNKSNTQDWNLACLCQRCHLHIQGKVKLEQFFMFEHTGWMKPHVEGYYKSLKDNST